MEEKERQYRIAYAQRQFAIHQSYATYWCAVATTGVAQLRDISRGATGGGWDQLSDQEKTQEALQTMHRHIGFMLEINDSIDTLMRGDKL